MTGETGAPPDRAVVVFLCDGATCCSRIAVRDLRQQLLSVVREEGWDGQVHIDRETCFGHCRMGPNMLVAPAHLAVMGPPPPGTAGVTLHTGLDSQSAIRALRGHLGGNGHDPG